MTSPSPTPAFDAEAVATVVESCPSVARLTAGNLGVEVATYLPGRRVRGVRLDGGTVEVHVAARHGVPLPRVGEDVRAAVAPLVGGAPVSVYIDDLDEADSP